MEPCGEPASRVKLTGTLQCHPLLMSFVCVHRGLDPDTKKPFEQKFSFSPRVNVGFAAAALPRAARHPNEVFINGDNCVHAALTEGFSRGFSYPT